MKNWVLIKAPCWRNWIHCIKGHRKVVSMFPAIGATLSEILEWEAIKRSRHLNITKLRAMIPHSVSWKYQISVLSFNSSGISVPSRDIRRLNGCSSTLNTCRWGRGGNVRCKILSAFRKFLSGWGLSLIKNVPSKDNCPWQVTLRALSLGN